MLSQDNAHSNQFGFREGRCTSMACNFINDLLHYCESKQSPVFLCSLDAEKCFDSIWHEGLFYKLMHILPKSHWLFLYKWYQSMECVVRWDGTYSQCFPVLRGTKQGSILSPTLFNIFINDLLIELTSSNVGIRIEDELFNSFAYADDVNLASLTVVDLQRLIDICYSYSRKWRFSFGIKKTMCMISGHLPFTESPIWNLGGHNITITDNMEILGTVFSSNLSCDGHINKRAQASRRAMYALTSVGCSYPGLATDVKVHMWKTVGLPSLLYNMETFSLNSGQQKSVESTQAAIVKYIVGFPKRSHHTCLLQAVGISNVKTAVTRRNLSLWRRVFQTDSPARRLSGKLLKQFLSGSSWTPGTLLSRVISAGYSPTKSIFDKEYYPSPADDTTPDGVVDSLRYLIRHENFIKPYSEEHVLATLLTKAF